jgi:hypothetical protein
VKGDSLFKEYWNRPEATAEAFDAEGWFRTGDTGTLEGAPAYYRILGRTSVDVIKSGGYKISALHIESVILEHPRVRAPHRPPSWDTSCAQRQWQSAAATGSGAPAPAPPLRGTHAPCLHGNPPPHAHMPGVCPSWQHAASPPPPPGHSGGPPGARYPGISAVPFNFQRVLYGVA